MHDVTIANAAIYGQSYRDIILLLRLSQLASRNVTIVMPELRYIYAWASLRDVTIVVRTALGVRGLAFTLHFCPLFSF